MAGAGGRFFSGDTPELVIKSMFKKYDKDGNGILQKQEILELLIEDMGVVQKKRIEAYMLLIDKDGNGYVTFDEFLKWIRDTNFWRNVEDCSRFRLICKAVELFKSFDKDSSGTIEREEFKELMKQTKNNIDTDVALNALDKNGDGKISFTEFLSWLNWLPGI